MSDSFILFLFSVLLSSTLVGGYRVLALRRSWLAQPNNRSAHLNATPRSAGLVILLLSSAVIGYQFLTGQLQSRDLLALVAVLAIGLVGLIDDARPLSPQLRFSIYLFLCALMVSVFYPLPELQLFSVSLKVWWLLLAVYIIATTWWVNLFNFMDGINGLAGSQFLFVLIAANSLLFVESSPPLELMTVVGGAVLGFLAWNVSGKVFLGDAGSTFLAAILAWLMLYTIVFQGASPWMWLILCGLFVVDATYTLLVRIITGQLWYSAHSNHSYQIVARRWESHHKVVLAAMMINLLWLWPLAWSVTKWPDMGLGFMVLAYCPLLLVCKQLNAGVDSGPAVDLGCEIER